MLSGRPVAEAAVPLEGYALSASAAMAWDTDPLRVWPSCCAE
jgi:hypothetical protein